VRIKYAWLLSPEQHEEASRQSFLRYVAPQKQAIEK